MAERKGKGDIQTAPPDPREVFIENVIQPTGVPKHIVEAFRQVDRREFVPIKYAHFAYTDQIIPLGKDSSISQPSLVARMIACANPKPGGNALEIGTATGYQASVLAQIVDHVDTIEINPKLANQAKKNIKRLDYDQKITVHVDDGTRGIEGNSYDTIVVTAALKSMPQSLLDQLAAGGTMVAPVGESLAESMLTAYVKDENGEVTVHELEPCCFVHIKTRKTCGWSKAEVQEAEMVRFTWGIAEQLRRNGHDPNERFNEIRQSIATHLGRKNPLGARATLEIMKEISDAMTPPTIEPVFED